MADEKHAVMTTAEVAAAFGVDVRTVARWARAGKLQCIRLPSGHRRYRREVIEQMLESK